MRMSASFQRFVRDIFDFMNEHGHGSCNGNEKSCIVKLYVRIGVVLMYHVLM